jgi:hypothetical protein
VRYLNLRSPWVIVVCVLLFGAGRASAQTTSVASMDDDDAVLDAANPDYRVINLPTTARLPVHKANFDLTHRFNGNFRGGDFARLAGDLFGLDNGATIGLEYRYAVLRHVQAAIYRVNVDKLIQLHGKYDMWRQGAALPVAASVLLSVEGADNFRERYTPALGVALSRTLSGHLALYAAPTWVHNSAPLIGDTRDTFFVGVGGRIRLLPAMYVVAEVSPRLGGYEQGPPAFGFGIEGRKGGHMFQLNFNNGQGSTFGQIARGGNPNALYMGFNIARKFF